MAPVVEISLAPEDLGRIIGKQGTQVKVLRDKSGCDIFIDTTNELSPVARLKGTPENIDLATNLIMNISGVSILTLTNAERAYLNHKKFEEIKKKLQISTEFRTNGLKIIPKDGKIGTAQNAKEILLQTLNEANKIVIEELEFEFEVFDSKTFNELLRQYSAHQLEYSIIYSDNNERPKLQLRGKLGFVSEAIAMFELIQQKNEATLTIAFFRFMLDNCLPKKKEDFMHDLKKTSERYKIDVSFKTQPAVNEICLQGKQSLIDVVSGEIEQLLEYYFPDNCAFIYMPAYAFDDICGPNFEHLKDLTKEDLIINGRKNQERVWICGPSSKAEEVYNCLVDKVAEWEKKNILIPVKNDRIVPLLRQNISRMEHTIGCSVSLEQNVVGIDTCYCIWIHGSLLEPTQRAKVEIEQLLQSCREAPRGPQNIFPK